MLYSMYVYVCKYVCMYIICQNTVFLMYLCFLVYRYRRFFEDDGTLLSFNLLVSSLFYVCKCLHALKIMYIRMFECVHTYMSTVFILT